MDRRVTKVVSTTRICIVGLASSQLYFVLSNSKKKEEGNGEEPEYKQCHIVLYDCTVTSRQDMANDLGMIKGSEDKNCELLDQCTYCQRRNSVTNQVSPTESDGQGRYIHFQGGR